MSTTESTAHPNGLRQALAADPLTPVEYLLRMVGAPDVHTRINLAGNPTTLSQGFEHIVPLVRDPDVRVRAALAEHLALMPAAASLLAEDTDWRQIAALYFRLHLLQPSPVVALNGAVAVSMAEGPATALPLVEALRPKLEGYHLWHAARGELLEKLARREEAEHAFERARELAENEAERRFLAGRLTAYGS